MSQLNSGVREKICIAIDEPFAWDEALGSKCVKPIQGMVWFI
jgi:hypothetical protein